MTIGFRSILVISFEKKNTISFRSVNGNFEGFFHFFSKWSPFSKMLFFNGDIKIS